MHHLFYPVEGSSRKTSCGPPIRAIATESLRLFPPDSVFASWRAGGAAAAHAGSAKGRGNGRGTGQGGGQSTLCGGRSTWSAHGLNCAHSCAGHLELVGRESEVAEHLVDEPAELGLRHALDPPEEHHCRVAATRSPDRQRRHDQSARRCAVQPVRRPRKPAGPSYDLPPPSGRGGAGCRRGCVSAGHGGGCVSPCSRTESKSSSASCCGQYPISRQHESHEM